MDWKMFQQEQKDWSLYNFGVQGAHRPLLGMIEELGEMIEAKCVDDYRDGIADVMIYMCDYCNHMDFDLGELIEQSFLVPDQSDRILALVCQMAKAHLKMEQNIRGGAEVHKDRMRKLLWEVLSVLRSACEQSDNDLNNLVQRVWSDVSRRDWVKHPLNGLPPDSITAQ